MFCYFGFGEKRKGEERRIFFGGLFFFGKGRTIKSNIFFEKRKSSLSFSLQLIFFCFCLQCPKEIRTNFFNYCHPGPFSRP